MATDKNGKAVATSDRHDTPPTLSAAGKTLKSVRWDGDVVTWTPWTDGMAPQGQQWVGHVERFVVDGD
ncbi:hypothetical protein Acy02nite_90790 [Actinoplanes cyaneus]|uniref:Uncharacterized protein n=1 Tax=Actinoplanes cyaneus TaxID=52696 RepID=A0A919MB44_9ACTN|nr:hypothetical protein [Actinoplanes cyaneus]MCW2144522.1 hypothetical protein [Actinoplanes cyaneus]GID71198.1 hypothetical protein Acy02nite_90790 [Actinoplanes cyaneus]